MKTEYIKPTLRMYDVRTLNIMTGSGFTATEVGTGGGDGGNGVSEARGTNGYWEW